MCDTKHTGINGPVPEDLFLYRAGSRPTFINLSELTVNPEAFYKQGLNHTDGLSLALTPEDSVAGLSKYSGILKVRVSDILALNLGLSVVYEEPAIPGDAKTHALIRNLPCMDKEVEEKGLAIAAAGSLAPIAQVHSNVKYKK